MELANNALKPHVEITKSKHVRGIDPKQSTLGDRAQNPGTLFLEEKRSNPEDCPPKVPNPGNLLPLKGI
jgi:hypothetical protein